MSGKHILLIIGLASFFSCSQRVTQEDLIKEAVSLKINQWKESQRITCRDRAILKAEAYVDSFLLAISLNVKLDTIPKPPKPMKPPKPAFKTKPDSLRVDSVFEKQGK